MNFGKFGLIAFSASMLLLTGCTRSLSVNYVGGFDGNSTIQAASKQKVAILPFVDDRSWVDKADGQSRSFVGKQGVWKFGLTFGNQEFVPVTNLIQSLFVEEFTAAGYDALATTQATQDSAYALSGRIMTFEFENEAGLLTVTSRRSVTLALTLASKDGSKLVDNLLVSENDRENEGLGVMHSTNADKLLNRAFKKVVNEVLTKLRPQLAARNTIDIRVTLNGVPVKGSWNTASPISQLAANQR